MIHLTTNRGWEDGDGHTVVQTEVYQYLMFVNTRKISRAWAKTVRPLLPLNNTACARETKLWLELGVIKS